MLSPRIIHLALLLSAGLATPLSFAQGNSTSPSQPSSGATDPQAPRIVDECAVQGTGATTCQAISIPTKVVSFQISDFKPGDENTHVYIVSGIAQAGCSGGGTARPDEYGLIQERVGESQRIFQDDRCQHFMIAMDKESFETRITLDLYEVGLAPFLASLEMAMNSAVRVTTRSRTNIPRPPWWVARHEQYKEQRVSIRGDNLTVDEVLDNIYQNSGCTVSSRPEGFMVDGCP